MPQIVIVIDELADLMMQAKDEVETQKEQRDYSRDFGYIIPCLRGKELLSSFPCCLLQSSCLFNVVTVY